MLPIRNNCSHGVDLKTTTKKGKFRRKRRNALVLRDYMDKKKNVAWLKYIWNPNVGFPAFL